MSISTFIEGIIPPDETWQRMQAAYNACKSAGVEPPREVRDFFGDDEPNGKGRSVELPATEWRDDNYDGFDVNVADIPPHVKIIRVRWG